MSDTQQYRVDILLNPFRFLAADLFLHGGGPQPTVEQLLRYLCTNDLDANMVAFLDRYKRLSQPDKPQMSMAPAEKDILNKMVFPLHHAKSSYLLGNYIGVVALCGMVAEMIAIMFYRLANLRFNGIPFTEAQEKGLFAGSFEKLGQDRRVHILASLQLIDTSTKIQFDSIRDLRKKYLHYLSEDHTDIERDSLKALSATEDLLSRLIQPRLVDGVVQFGPNLIEYLTKQGTIHPAAS
jgi:hypothetical protein